MYNNQYQGNQDIKNNIGQYVKSPQNLARISAHIYGLAKQYHNIELDERFKQTLLNTVDNTIKQFGHRGNSKISDQQHLENLNKVIIDDCMRYVQQYRNTMGNANPLQDYNDQKIDSDHLSKAVEDLAAARGYNFQHR